jgi:predicted NUDIX family phosphoesterase
MLLKSIPKGAEFTYGVHGPSLAAIVPDNAFTLLPQEQLRDAVRKLDEITMGSVRALNAKFELLRQGIGYILFYRIERDFSGNSFVQFMVYRRNKTNNEGQLVSKLSLGAGGHIEGFDVSYHRIIKDELLHGTPIIDMGETTDDSVDREGGEEVKLFDKDDQNVTGDVMVDAKEGPFNKIGFVMDSKPEEKGYVGNIHYGVVYAIDASEAVRFEMAEPQNDAVAWACADDLKNGDLFKNPECPLEPWSQMIADQIDAVEDYILTHFAPAA